MFSKNTKLLRTLPQGSQNPGTQTSEKSGHVVLISELPTTGAHQPMMPAECSCRLHTSQSFPLATFIASVPVRESINEVFPRCDQISPHVRRICPCLVQRSCQTHLAEQLGRFECSPRILQGHLNETLSSLPVAPHRPGGRTQAQQRVARPSMVAQLLLYGMAHRDEKLRAQPHRTVAHGPCTIHNQLT